jgi:hypothetical protein
MDRQAQAHSQDKVRIYNILSFTTGLPGSEPSVLLSYVYDFLLGDFCSRKRDGMIFDLYPQGASVRSGTIHLPSRYRTVFDCGHFVELYIYWNS